MAPRKRPDYSRPLPRPLVIPGVMRLKTLADVRKPPTKQLIRPKRMVLCCRRDQDL